MNAMQANAVKAENFQRPTLNVERSTKAAAVLAGLGCNEHFRTEHFESWKLKVERWTLPPSA
jgi:hypothetical protein